MRFLGPVCSLWGSWWNADEQLKTQPCIIVKESSLEFKSCCTILGNISSLSFNYFL